jgi:ribonucleoside-diphosphate reductase alpha chain
MRMRTADTAAFISDEFMTRVENHDTWYMFDPKETPDLIELYGQAFSARYAEYAGMADRGELRVFKKVPAEELYRNMLTSLQSTGHPWLTWKDPMNLRALNNNTGTIHMSNLCTEICLPQDRDNIAVCNLASLNLASHVHNKQIDWENLEESIRYAIHQLDNLIDINQLPIAEATHSDHENRAVGLGVMGFSDMLEQIGLSYESEHAHNFADKVFEFISYVAIDESANLAAARGSYNNFKGSGWSKGMVPIDTIKTLENGRGMDLTVSKDSRYRGLNWDALREKVKKGMRNATLMATAPNANIGLLAGTTPGIDVRFAQVFSRNKISGKYLDLNHNLVNDLKNMGIWEKVKEQIIADQGDISAIDEIPQHIRDIYKTSFSTSPYAVIEVAARAQKWVDQSLSRNMYLETRDINETMDIYSTAWKKGLKSTYYLHMKPRHTAEQSTVRVNKAEQMGKRGFAAVMTADSVSVEENVNITVQDAISSFSEEPVMATTAEAHMSASAPAEATLAKAQTHPTEAHVHTTSSPAGPFSSVAATSPVTSSPMQPSSQPQAQSRPAAAPTANAPRIMPPSDPSEANICDSCQ